MRVIIVHRLRTTVVVLKLGRRVRGHLMMLLESRSPSGIRGDGEGLV